MLVLAGAAWSTGWKQPRQRVEPKGSKSRVIAGRTQCTSSPAFRAALRLLKRPRPRPGPEDRTSTGGPGEEGEDAGVIVAGLAAAGVGTVELDGGPGAVSQSHKTDAHGESVAVEATPSTALGLIR